MSSTKIDRLLALLEGVRAKNIKNASGGSAQLRSVKACYTPAVM